jgi:hypothetical protein
MKTLPAPVAYRYFRGMVRALNSERVGHPIVGLAVVSALLLAGAGCGSSADTTGTQSGANQRSRQHAHRQAAKRRAVLRHQAKVRARHAAARARARRAHRAEIREVRSEAEARQQATAEEAAPEEESECDPNYSGACLNPYSSDYDCEGGSGNGPDYTGTVTVVGEDHYGLDADADGVGCEPA